MVKYIFGGVLFKFMIFWVGFKFWFIFCFKVLIIEIFFVLRLEGFIILKILFFEGLGNIIKLYWKLFGFWILVMFLYKEKLLFCIIMWLEVEESF